ncbi:MAG TPA: precorrin-6A/cobalt-precorrin-6A reductase [Dongiaceae bacterium]|nr:precorrin-6A/cobalt-precorrin-6A reductase [Dongiaceae bacterium]
MPVSPDLDILLLGETGEAEELVLALRDRSDCHVCRPSELGISPAELTDSARLRALLSDRGIRLVVNAAGPYEAALSDCALDAAVATEGQVLRVTRPPWHRDLLDSWIEVPSVAAAADICRWYGKRILVTLTEADLAPFAGNDRCHFIIRLPAAPAGPLDLAHYDLVIGRGPFPWLDERRLMMEQQIDLLVSRNSGGLDAYAKIDVARDLAIPVVMIRRPVSPMQPQAETIAQALTWIDAWRQAQREH